MAANRGSMIAFVWGPQPDFSLSLGGLLMQQSKKTSKQTKKQNRKPKPKKLHESEDSLSGTHCEWARTLLFQIAAGLFSLACVSHVIHTDRTFNCLLFRRVPLSGLEESWGRVVPHHAVYGLSLNWRSPELGPLRSAFSFMGLRSQWSWGWVLHTFPYSVFPFINSFPYMVQIRTPSWMWIWWNPFWAGNNWGE